MTLRDYLRVIRRRKWIIVTAAVLVPAAAIAFSLHQPKLYQANAQVLLNAQNLATQLAGVSQTGGTFEPQTEIVQTQALVARVPVIAYQTLQKVGGTGLTVKGFLAKSSVSAATNADLLTFSVTDHSPSLASRLVNAYAAAYTAYRRQLDTASLKTALQGVDDRLKQLQKAGQETGSLYAALVQSQQTLQTIEALQTSNASVVQEADGTVETQPKTTRNAILGLALGILLGIGLAFLREALDTRIQSAEEIGERLGHIPLLARVAAPPKRFAGTGRLVMVDEPHSPYAETFRILRTNLDFACLGRDIRSLMITSAVEQEGKSTTIANLAVALARAGKRVVLVDLDLRRPYLHRFFGLEGMGVTQVALGHTTLGAALVPIALAEYVAPVGEARSANGQAQPDAGGMLRVLPSGPTPPDPGEFVGTRALVTILEQLQEDSDLVLIDSPPVLPFGDALALSKHVDGILLATRMTVARRGTLHELARQLQTVPTPVLGFVTTDAGEELASGHGYGYGYGQYGYAHPSKAPSGSGV
jgi:Mrp family chromosome partitioning ATPase/capsular polysaccharide biosynthesis protein